MILPVNDSVNKKPYKSFKSANNVKKGYIARRYHTSETVEFNTKIKAATGAIIGTIIQLLYFTRKNPGLKNIINMKYGLKEMVVTSITGISGGAAFGMIGEPHKKRERKRKEAVFQIMNCTLPLLGVAGFLKLSEKIKGLNNKPAKVIGTLAGVTAGMFGGAKLSNLINDPKDLEPDRKIELKDTIANVDDVFSALVLAKFPFVDKLHIEKLLPVIFAWCGYRAGQSN